MTFVDDTRLIVAMTTMSVRNNYTPLAPDTKENCLLKYPAPYGSAALDHRIDGVLHLLD